MLFGFGDSFTFGILSEHLENSLPAGSYRIRIRRDRYYNGGQAVGMVADLFTGEGEVETVGNVGRSVLGHNPEYVSLAERLGADPSIFPRQYRAKCPRPSVGELTRGSSIE